MKKGAGAAAGARGRSLLAAGKESNDTKQSEEEGFLMAPSSVRTDTGS